jgi:hypothetical protein
VSDLDPADQKLLGPVLRSPVLRQLLVAMSGAAQQAAATAASDGLSSWLSNPRVLQLLREAARALRKGLLTEDQLVKLLQQEVKVSGWHRCCVALCVCETNPCLHAAELLLCRHGGGLA